MSERDCEKCKHHTEKGCDSWDCEFERRMARKEIIEMLKVLKEQALESHNDTAIIDVKKDSFIYVMDATINSLKMEQIEPCEDAVSRKAINNLRKYNLVGGISTVSLKDINKLPSVNPQEPKTGHWIRDTITDLYHCSKCRSICHQDSKSKDDYCRYCGAKMEESEETE